MTTSVLKLRPTMQDHDQMLSCRAENPVLTNSVKDDSVRLEVYCERSNCDNPRREGGGLIGNLIVFQTRR